MQSTTNPPKHYAHHNQQHTQHNTQSGQIRTEPQIARNAHVSNRANSPLTLPACDSPQSNPSNCHNTVKALSQNKPASHKPRKTQHSHNKSSKPFTTLNSRHNTTNLAYFTIARIAHVLNRAEQPSRVIFRMENSPRFFLQDRKSVV
jgi:hypothetical protein